MGSAAQKVFFVDVVLENEICNFFKFWSVFWWFWEGQMDAKIDVGDVFFDVVFYCVFVSIFGVFSKAPNLGIVAPVEAKH